MGKWRDHVRIILLHTMIIEFTKWEYGGMPGSSVAIPDVTM